MAERGWQRSFDDPTTLPNGRKLITLRNAGHHIAKLPKATHDRPEWQAAVEALISSGRASGPTMLARIA
jgi:hypothetical protein